MVSPYHFCALGCPLTSYPTRSPSYLVDSCYDAVGEGIETSEDVEDAAPARWIGLGRFLAGAPHGPLTKPRPHWAAMGWAGAATTAPPTVQCVPTKDVVHHQWMRSESRIQSVALANTNVAQGRGELVRFLNYESSFLCWAVSGGRICAMSSWPQDFSDAPNALSAAPSSPDTTGTNFSKSQARKEISTQEYQFL